jgi:hypothetical protein
MDEYIRSSLMNNRRPLSVLDQKKATLPVMLTTDMVAPLVGRCRP